MVLQTDGNLERGVTLGAYSIPRQAVLVCFVAQVMEHKFVSPCEDAVTNFAYQLRVAGSAIPVHASCQSLANVELEEIRRSVSPISWLSCI